MDRNQVIGIVLIFSLFIVWYQFFAPSPEELQADQMRQDSIALVEQQQEASAAAEADLQAVGDTTAAEATATVSDSALIAQRAGAYGVFASSSVGEKEQVVLENDLMKITFSTQGGAVEQVELKEHFKVHFDSANQEVKEALYLLNDPKNKIEYLLPLATGMVKSSDLYFTPQLEENTLRLRAEAGPGQYFEQIYKIEDGSYLVDYDIRFEGLQQAFRNDAQKVDLHWVNYLDKIELNDNYERNYSTVYFKPADDDTDRCSCTSTDEEQLPDQSIKWVSHAQQFFNTTLFADDRFVGVTASTEVLDADSDELKLVTSTISIPYGHAASENFGMQFYLGPNDFERMQAIGSDFTDVIPYGRSIFGAINRWMIRPIFNFIDNFIGNKGIAILLLTLLVKILVFPLTYRMLKSQSKMQAMKPYIEKMKEKYKDDQQTQQMETMKLYREYGVNPLGGCFPMLLQMPIWFALYRFFPAALTFRQESFLWAHDLSSYDIFFRLPFEVPLGFGAHLSLFALLWAVTTLIYTYYNTKHMDYGANPSMKYIQYLMPVMFLGFFNSFASGLTCYLFFSNLFNITQTIVTKNFVIDQEKIKVQLEENRKKPKKKGGFQERLQEALKEQQRKQAQLEAAKGKGKKKRK